MPSVRVATSPERKTRNRSASVPVSQRDNSRLESLRSSKRNLSILNVEDAAPSDLPGVVTARGRKRDPPSCATSQTDCVPPQKRSRRSSSTSAAPSLSQLSIQLQPRRRSRSRAGSPTTDIGYASSARATARLARKIHPLIDGRSSDIYTHLAGPGGAGKLLNEPSADSVALSSSNGVVSPWSTKQPRGRRRRVVDLTNENAKKDLMEEWARMRQSQGALPPSGIDENACSGQMRLRDARKADELASSVQVEEVTQGNSSDETTITSVPQPREAVLDISTRHCTSMRTEFGNALPGSGKKTDHQDSTLPADGGTEHLGVDAEAPTSTSDPHTSQAFPSYEPAGVRAHLASLQCSESSPPALSALHSREDLVCITKLTRLPANDQGEALDLDSPPEGIQTSSIDNSNVYLDSDAEFYMLDVPDIFALPWVPVTPNLYVPPSLGKLISGMRGQLMVEARARRRAEELFQSELSRRVSAEKVIEDLRTELDERQKDLFT